MANLMRWTLGIASRTGRLLVIIPKDTPLPAKRSIVVTTVENSQTNIGLSAFLGQRPVASENYIISRIKIAEIEPAPKGTPRVKLTFYVYTNGVYEIGICRKEGDTEQKMSIIPSSGLSQDEVALIQQKITKMAEACIPQELQASDLGILLMPAIE